MLTPQNCLWFNGRGIIGVVRAVNEAGEISYLVGVGDGLNENIDVNLITSHGAYLPQAVGEAFFGREKPVATRPSRPSRVSTVDSKGKPKTSKRSPKKSSEK